jgi:hypothetical protein
VKADDERHHHGDGEQHVDHRGGRVGAQALVDAQHRVGVFEVGERPQPEHRDPEDHRVVAPERDPAQRGGEREQQRRDDRGGHEHEDGRPAHERVAALRILV